MERRGGGGGGQRMPWKLKKRTKITAVKPRNARPSPSTPASRLLKRRSRSRTGAHAPPSTKRAAKPVKAAEEAAERRQVKRKKQKNKDGDDLHEGRTKKCGRDAFTLAKKRPPRPPAAVTPTLKKEGTAADRKDLLRRFSSFSSTCSSQKEKVKTLKYQLASTQEALQRVLQCQGVEGFSRAAGSMAVPWQRLPSPQAGEPSNGKTRRGQEANTSAATSDEVCGGTPVSAEAASSVAQRELRMLKRLIYFITGGQVPLPIPHDFFYVLGKQYLEGKGGEVSAAAALAASPDNSGDITHTSVTIETVHEVPPPLGRATVGADNGATPAAGEHRQAATPTAAAGAARAAAGEGLQAATSAAHAAATAPAAASAAAAAFDDAADFAADVSSSPARQLEKVEQLIRVEIEGDEPLEWRDIYSLPEDGVPVLVSSTANRSARAAAAAAAAETETRKRETREVLHDASERQLHTLRRGEQHQQQQRGIHQRSSRRRRSSQQGQQQPRMAFKTQPDHAAESTWKRETGYSSSSPAEGEEEEEEATVEGAVVSAEAGRDEEVTSTAAAVALKLQPPSKNSSSRSSGEEGGKWFAAVEEETVTLHRRRSDVLRRQGGEAAVARNAGAELWKVQERRELLQPSLLEDERLAANRRRAVERRIGEKGEGAESAERRRGEEAEGDKAKTSHHLREQSADASLHGEGNGDERQARREERREGGGEAQHTAKPFPPERAAACRRSESSTAQKPPPRLRPNLKSSLFNEAAAAAAPPQPPQHKQQQSQQQLQQQRQPESSVAFEMDWKRQESKLEQQQQRERDEDLFATPLRTEAGDGKGEKIVEEERRTAAKGSTFSAGSSAGSGAAAAAAEEKSCGAVADRGETSSRCMFSFTGTVQGGKQCAGALASGETAAEKPKTPLPAKPSLSSGELDFTYFVPAPGRRRLILSRSNSVERPAPGRPPPLFFPAYRQRGETNLPAAVGGSASPAHIVNNITAATGMAAGAAPPPPPPPGAAAAALGAALAAAAAAALTRKERNGVPPPPGCFFDMPPCTGGSSPSAAYYYTPTTQLPPSPPPSPVLPSSPAAAAARAAPRGEITAAAAVEQNNIYALHAGHHRVFMPTAAAYGALLQEAFVVPPPPPSPASPIPAGWQSYIDAAAAAAPLLLAGAAAAIDEAEKGASLASSHGDRNDTRIDRNGTRGDRGGAPGEELLLRHQLQGREKKIAALPETAAEGKQKEQVALMQRDGEQTKRREEGTSAQPQGELPSFTEDLCAATFSVHSAEGRRRLYREQQQQRHTAAAATAGEAAAAVLRLLEPAAAPRSPYGTPRWQEGGGGLAAATADGQHGSAAFAVSDKIKIDSSSGNNNAEGSSQYGESAAAAAPPATAAKFSTRRTVVHPEEMKYDIFNSAAVRAVLLAHAQETFVPMFWNESGTPISWPQMTVPFPAAGIGEEDRHYMEKGQQQRKKKEKAQKPHGEERQTQVAREAGLRQQIEQQELLLLEQQQLLQGDQQGRAAVTEGTPAQRISFVPVQFCQRKQPQRSGWWCMDQPLLQRQQQQGGTLLDSSSPGEWQVRGWKEDETKFFTSVVNASPLLLSKRYADEGQRYPPFFMEPCAAGQYPTPAAASTAAPALSVRAAELFACPVTRSGRDRDLSVKKWEKLQHPTSSSAWQNSSVFRSACCAAAPSQPSSAESRLLHCDSVRTLQEKQQLQQLGFPNKTPEAAGGTAAVKRAAGVNVTSALIMPAAEGGSAMESGKKKSDATATSQGPRYFVFRGCCSGSGNSPLQQPAKIAETEGTVNAMAQQSLESSINNTQTTSNAALANIASILKEASDLDARLQQVDGKVEKLLSSRRRSRAVVA